MRTKLSNVRANSIHPLQLALAASIMLALAFTFSCSSSDDGGGNNLVSSSSSSSQTGQSSSNAMPEYGYCVFISDRICLAGPMSNCSPGGTLSNSCPYGSSSSAAASSSSSVPSSSSTLSSSSSALPSSSSVATYTVTYNAGTGVTGVAVPDKQTKIHDVALTLSSAVPTRTNYTFSSWNTSANGSGTSYASGARYTANASLTLYAQWNINGPSVSYGGETYESVVIGSQTWLKRNLNYNAEGSKCGNGRSLSDANTSTCDTYGRLYNWSTAMALSSSCTSSSCSSQINAKHRGICPSGWHIPSDADWIVLMKYVDPSCSDNSVCANAGRLLKATGGWSYNGNGTDEFGFSALPGGGGYSGGGFGIVGDYGFWWSATEGDSDFAYSRGMYFNHEYAYWNNYYPKDYLFSVRCLQD
jgi:uncharacterized protein (TIGR02145 family)/uncharacterized repeat protein (TIGR02543 family)